jgi:hypothetical protein
LAVVLVALATSLDMLFVGSALIARRPARRRRLVILVALATGLGVLFRGSAPRSAGRFVVSHLSSS